MVPSCEGNREDCGARLFVSGTVKVEVPLCCENREDCDARLFVGCTVKW